MVVVAKNLLDFGSPNYWEEVLVNKVNTQNIIALSYELVIWSVRILYQLVKVSLPQNLKIRFWIKINEQRLRRMIVHGLNPEYNGIITAIRS